MTFCFRRRRIITIFFNQEYLSSLVETHAPHSDHLRLRKDELLKRNTSLNLKTKISISVFLP